MNQCLAISGGSTEDAFIYQPVCSLSAPVCPYVCLKKVFEEAEQEPEFGRLEIYAAKARLRLVNHNMVLERCFVDCCGGFDDLLRMVCEEAACKSLNHICLCCYFCRF